jgi:hypothetical protein
MNFDTTNDQEEFISKVDSVCTSLRSFEEECYIQDKFNEKLVPEFSKIGMLGCPISKQYEISALLQNSQYLRGKFVN